MRRVVTLGFLLLLCQSTLFTQVWAAQDPPQDKDAAELQGIDRELAGLKLEAREEAGTSGTPIALMAVGGGVGGAGLIFALLGVAFSGTSFCQGSCPMLAWVGVANSAGVLLGGLIGGGIWLARVKRAREPYDDRIRTLRARKRHLEARLAREGKLPADKLYKKDSTKAKVLMGVGGGVGLGLGAIGLLSSFSNTVLLFPSVLLALAGAGCLVVGGMWLTTLRRRHRHQGHATAPTHTAPPPLAKHPGDRDKDPATQGLRPLRVDF